MRNNPSTPRTDDLYELYDLYDLYDLYGDLSRFMHLDIFREDKFLICMICVIELMLPGGSRITCTI